MPLVGILRVYTWMHASINACKGACVGGLPNAEATRKIETTTATQHEKKPLPVVANTPILAAI